MCAVLYLYHTFTMMLDIQLCVAVIAVLIKLGDQMFQTCMSDSVSQLRAQATDKFACKILSKFHSIITL